MVNVFIDKEDIKEFNEKEKQKVLKDCVSIGKDDLNKLKKEYDNDIFSILKEQIEYSSDHKDSFSIIPNKSDRKIKIKKLTSIRKLLIAPIIHLDENYFPHLTYGAIVYNDRIMYTIGNKEYVKVIREYQPIFYSENISENCYICSEKLPYTFTFKEFDEIIRDKDIKKILEHTVLSIGVMNDEYMSKELQNFVKTSQNVILIALGSGLAVGLLGGFALGKIF